MTKHRWHEGPRVVWGLFGLVGILLASLATVAWGVVQNNGTRINGLEKVIPAIQTQHEDIMRRLQRIEDKIDDGR